MCFNSNQFNQLPNRIQFFINFFLFFFFQNDFFISKLNDQNFCLYGVILFFNKTTAYILIKQLRNNKYI